MRWLLYAAAILVLAAGLQLFVFAGRTATYFAWTIRNPLAARQRAWANARVAVPAVLAFTVLTLAATLAHLDLFHLGGQFAMGTQIVTSAWIAVYAVVPLLMLIVLARYPGLFRWSSAPGVLY
jgi:hypothetical protein